MSLSEDLVFAWTAMCASTGHILPITGIGVNELSHEVAAGDPPLQMPDGPARRVTLVYAIEEYDDELPN
jgi:hypothetical protein